MTDIGNEPNTPQSSSLIGYSENIKDPAFAAYQKKSIIWSFLFAGILAVIAIIGFPIYGERSGELERAEALRYGFIIGGMFIVIALLQTLKHKFDHSWDGVVEYKDSYRQQERDNNNTSSYSVVYEMRVRKDRGGVAKHKWRNLPGPYSYYNVGDRVRHHKGFYYYEKYDKSKDAKIMCAACMSFIDIDKDVCPRCKCPLLK